MRVWHIKLRVTYGCTDWVAGEGVRDEVDGIRLVLTRHVARGAEADTMWIGSVLMSAIGYAGGETKWMTM